MSGIVFQEMVKKAARKRAATKGSKGSKAKRSHLESKWAREWARQGGPELVEEFRFHETRKWRADFAHLGTRTLIEIEGGAAGGRHTRIAGFKADLDKYLTAHLHGWTVVRIGAHQVTGPIVRAVIGRLLAAAGENSAESIAEHSAESRRGGGAASCGDCGQRVGECVCLPVGERGAKGAGSRGRDSLAIPSRPAWLSGPAVEFPEAGEN